MKRYFEKFAMCFFLLRTNWDSLEYLQAENSRFIVAARIFHLLQLFCCTLPCNLQNACLVQFFSSASYREMLLEAVRINSTFMCVLWSLQDSELSFLWALAIILTPVSLLLVESLWERLFFAIEAFSLLFLVQTAKTYLFQLVSIAWVFFYSLLSALWRCYSNSANYSWWYQAESSLVLHSSWVIHMWAKS